MSINSKLALNVQLVGIYLENIGIGGKLTNLHEESSLVKASLVDEQNKVLVNIVGVGIEPSKAMVSLYQNDKSLGQAIFDYERDLLITDDLGFPLKMKQFLEPRETQVLTNINSKYKLSPPSLQVPLQETPLQESSQSIPVGLGSVGLERPPSGLTTQNVRGAKPSDMPDFEDEYQVRQGPQFLGPQQPLGAYGDTDLYPMGRRNPPMSDPLMTPPVGGMAFDPAQDSARRRELDEMRNRGPGFMPGTKWDDPFGRQGFGPGGPGGFGPGGFGPGGFI